MSRLPMQVIGLLSFFVLGGCAEYMAEVRRESCLPHRMYERGYNDARVGSSMNSPGGCTDTAVFTRYREGYLAARAEEGRRYALDSRKAAESPARAQTVQMVDASHAKGVVVVNATGPATGSRREDQIRQDSLRAWEQRSWLCRLAAFDKNFSAWGSDRASAHQSAISACRARTGEMFCKEVLCEANAPIAARAPGLHKCRVEAFGVVFGGDGATDLEAKETARAACLEKHGVKFCSDISCAMVP